MSIIHEAATVTAKGRITLPKSIRQVLRVEVGDKVAFELHENGRDVVSRAAADDEDPAIGAFLGLLADDIRAGRSVQAIPADLAQDMLEHAGRAARPAEEIEGDVDR
ncbi:MAG: AbrB/MazE/SpoVT family DNA-binding domain-containing protein [Chloroflexi bacterium]|nr:AbrB/MazE/SpoVT family DNA-binding domain-containing protein [Chloroflexota bacterium]